MLELFIMQTQKAQRYILQRHHCCSYLCRAQLDQHCLLHLITPRRLVHGGEERWDDEYLGILREGQTVGSERAWRDSNALYSCSRAQAYGFSTVR